MGTYRCSDGTKVTKAQIDRNVRKAKEAKINMEIEKYGYLVCQDCHRNDDVPIDCSHEIPVSECQDSGRSELAWSLDNIKIRGRKCHKKHDGL